MTELPLDEAAPDTAAASPKKKPAPKPGDADYDWAPHYPDTANVYRHTFPDGTVVGLRPFAAIYSKTWLYKLRKAQTDTDIQFAAIDRGACDVAQTLIESVDAPLDGPDPIDDLWSSWSASGTAHAEGEPGLTAGE